MSSAFTPQRTVHCADATVWLREPHSDLAEASFITSLPDVSEMSGLGLSGWKRWFMDAAGLVLHACPRSGVAIFFQTDIRKDGVWVDKGYLVQRAAEDVGAMLLWHKVVCRAPAGSAVMGRPAYAHLLCFSWAHRAAPPFASPDVLPSAGAVTWTRGMGVAACELACQYVLKATTARTVVDPFCGHGTVLAVANALGLHAVGVEMSPKRARKARTLYRKGDALAHAPGPPKEDGPGD